MAKGNGTRHVEFDKAVAHAMVARAIDELNKHYPLTPQEQDWLYRLGMVGIMAAYASIDQDIPTSVRVALRTGKRLSKRPWREILGDADG